MLRKVNFQFSRTTEKQLKRLPKHILSSLEAWMESVLRLGLDGARKIPGYHDEPLKGRRSGQRSVRLSKAYRVIYSETLDGLIIYIFIVEVNKHDY